MTNREIVDFLANKRIGQKFITNEGYNIEITEYINCQNCTVIFENGISVSNLEYSKIKKGEVKNPYHKRLYNIGFFGEINIKTTKKMYQTWKGMLERCYDYELKYKLPSYNHVIVCDEWHNFQNFAQWFEEKYKEGFELDKDILVKGNKIYSPETCCFVPREINSLFVKRQNDRGSYPIGVTKSGTKFISRINKRDKRIDLGRFDTPEEAFQAYKIAKEQYIKEMANKWRGQITEPCYQALYNYKVQITD